MSGRYLIAVGVADPGPRARAARLPGVEPDLRRVHALFVDELGYEAVYLGAGRSQELNLDLSREEILQGVRRWTEQHGDPVPEALVFYFAGHAGRTPDQQLDLLTAGFDASVPDSGMRVADVAALLNDRANKRFIVLDVCYAARGASDLSDSMLKALRAYSQGFWFLGSSGDTTSYDRAFTDAFVDAAREGPRSFEGFWSTVETKLTAHYRELGVPRVSPMAAGNESFNLLVNPRAPRRMFRTDEFELAYHAWSSARHQAVLPTLGAAQPHTYIAQRFRRLSAEAADQAAPRGLTPEDVLARDSSFVVQGAPGSGKSAWMRWTFTQLLAQPGAFPIFVQLSQFARYVSAEGVALESALADYLAEVMREPAVRDAVLHKLEQQDTQRAVLFLDGWDELGAAAAPLAAALRDFLAARPRALAVIAGRPEAAHELKLKEVHHLEPWSDQDQREYVDAYFGATHAPQFHDALARNPDAKQLARTPLFLVMLCATGKNELPSKRHLIFEACVKALLETPLERGVPFTLRPVPASWRPDDAEERLRALARLSHRAHFKRAHSQSAPIWSRELPGTSSDELAAWLPESWSQAEKYGFLRWLWRDAGLLRANDDGTLRLAHRSIQEYLSAREMLSSVMKARHRGGQAYRSSFQAMEQSHGWEVVRHLLSMMQTLDPEGALQTLRMLVYQGDISELKPALTRRAKLVHDLFGNRNGFWLAGAMLADGLGDDALSTAWLVALPGNLLRDDSEAEFTAQVFAVCGHRILRETAQVKLTELARRAPWSVLPRLRSWMQTARLQSPDLPDASTMTGAVLSLRPNAHATPRELALGRVVWGSMPLWPGGSAIDALLLRAWPSPRVAAGARVQLIATLAEDTKTFDSMSSMAMRPAMQLRYDSSVAESVAASIHDVWLRTSIKAIASFSSDHDLAKAEAWIDRAVIDDWARDFACDFTGAWRSCFFPLVAGLFGLELASGGLWGAAKGVWSIVRQRNTGLDVSRAVKARAAPIFRHLVGEHFLIMTLYAATDSAVRASLDRHFAAHFQQRIGPDLTHLKLRWLDLKQLLRSVGFNDANQRQFEDGLPAWYLDFLALELSPWRYGIRAQLSSLDREGTPWPHARLIGAACREALHPLSGTAHVDQLAARFEGDPLWSALARAIARRASAADRALLEELSRHPERRSGALSAALQYYVRGDVVQRDWSDLTLDALCQKHGIPLLAHLD